MDKQTLLNYALRGAIAATDAFTTKELLGLGADPNWRDAEGVPLLAIAADTQDPAVIKTLVKAGAKLAADFSREAPASQQDPPLPENTG